MAMKVGETRVGNVLAGWNHLTTVGPRKFVMLPALEYRLLQENGMTTILWVGVRVSSATTVPLLGNLSLRLCRVVSFRNMKPRSINC